MSWIQVGGAAVTAFGQYEQGQGARVQGQMQAQQLDYQAKVDNDNALQQAQMIRRMQRNAIGSADTAAAASGVVVGQGSADEADRQIYQDTEHDAYQAILSGHRQARGLQVSAAGARAGGDVAAANADLRAVGSVLQGGYQAFRGWVTMPKGVSPINSGTPMNYSGGGYGTPQAGV